MSNGNDRLVVFSHTNESLAILPAAPHTAICTYARTRCKTPGPRIKFTRKRGRPSPCHELATNSRDCNIAGPSNCDAGARPIFSEAIREGETSADRIVVRARKEG